MNPISALNVAVATFQFLEFTLKTAKLFCEIRDAKDGATEANARLQKNSVAVKEMQTDLQNLLQQTRRNRNIRALSQDCCTIADDLQKILKDVREARKSKRFGAVKGLYKTLREKRTVEALENKLKDKERKLNLAVDVERLIRDAERHRSERVGQFKPTP